VNPLGLSGFAFAFVGGKSERSPRKEKTSYFGGSRKIFVNYSRKKVKKAK
jgi:hypothetical protein